MKTVPFNPAWLDSGLDLYAVYRRPRTQAITKAPLSDDQGRPLWDYSTLPLKRHNDWSKKGYQYVTLARVQDLVTAKIPLAPDLLAQYKPAGDLEERTFLVQAYLKHAAVADVDEFDKLAELVQRLGSDAVEEVMRHGNPAFVLPERLRGLAPGAAVPSSGTSADATVTELPAPTSKTANSARRAKPAAAPKEPVQA
jgi:hypothetical protein